MGNHSSFSKSVDQNDENLLRRNMRTFSPMPSLEEARTIRSRSLEPRATAEIHMVEHSKSARYTRKKTTCPRLWDPNDPRLFALARQEEQKRKQTLVDERPRSPSPAPGLVSERSCITGMTRHHKMILQKIWMRASEADINECSRNMMSHLLRSNQQLYQMFNLVGMTDKEIQQSIPFNRQAANFAMVFDFVITNLTDDLNRVAFALEFLGQHHADLGFTIDQPFWALFNRVFEDNPPKLVFQNPEGHQVWKLMVNFVVRQVKNGYVKEMESPQRKTSNTLHVDRPY
ncbi:unnamed protein product [Bursaphelenchus xylophilus]|uniref:(pine wood nematode) hypothetical protein n=1 Tax=Bursaphelenchus xylophilus TaxID=6326 RepID=A0A1I7RTA6_BURXY|nr:unnamed protein product [Bursaphelenchus xylophilus]CAG9122520.1 unnamed protein product [Bursaphelenchus xylophilus]